MNLEYINDWINVEKLWIEGLRFTLAHLMILRLCQYCKKLKTLAVTFFEYNGEQSEKWWNDIDPQFVASQLVDLKEVNFIYYRNGEFDDTGIESRWIRTKNGVLIKS